MRTPGMTMGRRRHDYIRSFWTFETLLRQPIHAEVVRIRISGVLCPTDSRDVRASDVCALGNERRLRMHHAGTHNTEARDASNSGPDSGHVFNPGEHDHSFIRLRFGLFDSTPAQSLDIRVF